MRNILVHSVVRGAKGARGLESVHVEGHAFGLERVQVSIRVGNESRDVVVDVSPTAHWAANFSRTHDRLPDAWSCGTEARVVAADPDDLDGCYSSAEARIEC